MTNRNVARILATVIVLGAARNAAAQPPGNEPGAPAPAAPSEADVKEAAARFGRGVELYREGDFRGALVEFKRAYTLSPDYRVLYNVAMCNLQLRDYVAAQRVFEQYLKEGGDAVPEERRREVQERKAHLAQRIARLTISVTVPDAEIFVDDIPIGRAPLPEAHLVSVGPHKVAAAFGGYLPAVQMVDLAGGDERTISLTMIPAEAAADATQRTEPAPARPAARTEAPPHASRTAAWVTGGAALALAAGATVTGLVTLSAKRDYDAQVSAGPISPSAMDSARGPVRNWALVTDVLAGTAIVAGAVSVYLFVTGANPKHPPSTAAAPVGFTF